MSVTHVTEFVLGLCARVVNEGVTDHDLMLGRLTAVGLSPDKRACDGRDTNSDVPSTLISVYEFRIRVPTCPRCAVLRDEALRGRLPDLKRYR